MTKQIEIFFDGNCVICNTEILHYKRIDTNNQIKIVDISHPDFDAKSLGLEADLVNKYMHVRDKDGKIHTKVDAFRVIWRELPKYNFMIGLSNNFLLKPFFNFGYEAFALVRPYLPKKAR